MFFKAARVLPAALALCLSTAHAASAPPENIARGQSVTFSAPPNYKWTTDPADIRQLTDGQYSSQGELREIEGASSLWLQPGTVGWQKISPIVITIDLGRVQPISGVSYSTAAGQGNVTWPRAIFLAVSDDGKSWRTAGNLLHLARKYGLPPQEGYANHRFTTHDLRTKGRYLAIGVAQYPYVFVDEIEVYKGDDAWLQQPAGGRAIADLKSWVQNELPPAMALRRVQTDADAVKAKVEASCLPASRKSTFLARLDNSALTASRVETLPPDFKAVLPLSKEHREVLAVHGELLAAQGFQPLTVWKQHRYAWLPLLATPEKQRAPRLDISMLKDQFRADAFLFTNATGKPQTVTLQLKNIPRGAGDGWLTVSSVAWTDTTQGVPVADALLPIQPENNLYRVDVPAGMTRKIWLTVDSSKLPVGTHKSTFDIRAGSEKTAVPLTVRVAPLAMKRPRMALSVWDHTNIYYTGLTPQNRAAGIALMRSHYVDTPTATKVALPSPAAEDFDAQNNLKRQPDFTNFDQWVARWPDARRYFVYLSVRDTFAGAKMGTPEFDARVGSWAKVLSAHMKEIGKQSRQLGLLLIDAAHTEAQDAIVATWAKAINVAAPELTLFSDPIWERPDQTKNQDAITANDLLYFRIPSFKAGGAAMKTYAETLIRQGKEVWLYQATGPIRLHDPQLTNRQLAWHTYSIGGTGEVFWAFADTGGVPSSWNEYAVENMSYAQIFVDETTVHSSLHWEAVREGIEDYEELAMLQDAIDASTNARWKKQAQQVLDGAVAVVTGAWSGNRDWQQEGDPYLTDRQLQKVREQLLYKRR